jgi:hypothetical protein
MMDDGLKKVLEGVTTPSEVIHAVYTAALMEPPAQPEGEGEDFTPQGAEPDEAARASG